MTELGMKDVFLVIVSVLTSLSVVLIFIVAGWYIVWVAFLSRFKLMRELLSVSDEDVPKNKHIKSSTSSSLAETASTGKRVRQNVTSQRT